MYMKIICINRNLFTMDTFGQHFGVHYRQVLCHQTKEVTYYMVKRHCVDSAEVGQVVFVRCVVTIPGHHIKGGVGLQ